MVSRAIALFFCCRPSADRAAPAADTLEIWRSGILEIRPTSSGSQIPRTPEIQGAAPDGDDWGRRHAPTTASTPVGPDSPQSVRQRDGRGAGMATPMGGPRASLRARGKYVRSERLRSSGSATSTRTAAGLARRVGPQKLSRCAGWAFGNFGCALGRSVSGRSDQETETQWTSGSREGNWPSPVIPDAAARIRG